MADPFVGEIRIWAFAWAPRNWALCDGSILTIQQNAALYSLIGNGFGGDGKVNFALPDLRGRTPLAPGSSKYDPQNYQWAKKGGQETVTLNATTVPGHAHQVAVTTANGTTTIPAGTLLANPVSVKAGSTTAFNTFLPAANWTADAQLAAGTVSTIGESAAHSNMQPYSVVNFAICLLGIYPPRD